MAKLRNLKQPYWYLGNGQLTPEFGRFQVEFMNLTHVPYHNRHFYFRGWEYWTVLRHLDLDENDKVLEIGCARHYTPVWLAQTAGEVVCIDNGRWEEITDCIEHYTVEQWYSEIVKYRTPGVISVMRRDVQSMPFPDNYFDAIVTFSVLEHVADDKLASEEMYRVLKPGGLCVGTVDFGNPSDAVYENYMYSNQTFHEHIVQPAGWEYVARPEPATLPAGHRGSMLYLLRKGE